MEKKELGLHKIEKSFTKKIEETKAKIYDGSVRSGNKIEYEGTVIIIGDINAGAEILRRFTLRTTFMDPLNAMTEKCDKENQKEKSLRLLIKYEDELNELVYTFKNNKLISLSK